MYLGAQFRLLEPNKDGSVSLENFRMVICSSIIFSFSSLEWFMKYGRNWLNDLFAYHYFNGLSFFSSGS